MAKADSKLTLEDFISSKTKKYRIGISDKNLTDIHLKPREQMVLRAKEDSKYSPAWLQTDNLSDLKSWIGVPDEVFDSRRCCQKYDWLPPVRQSAKGNEEMQKAHFEKMSASEQLKIRALTKDFIYRDSRPIKHYQKYLQQYWKVFKIPYWMFRTIHVSAGATLEIDPGVTGLLMAYKVEIEEGGRILTRKSMTMDVSILKKL